MISRALMILVVISSLTVVSFLQLPPKAMAQTPPSEGAKVLVDDAVQALKSNDIGRAQIHLNILNQQLPTFVNLSSIQSVKALLDDVNSALKNKNVNSALVLCYCCIQIASSVWKIGSRDIRDVLKISKLCNQADTEEDINRLLTISQKYHKTGKEFN
jgi:hypothetical protein